MLAGWARKPPPSASIASRHPERSSSRARVPCCGGLRPLLEPALLGLFGLDPGLVADQPQEREVGVDLAAEHGFEVELDVCLAGEADVVAQQPQGRPLETMPHRCSWERFSSS